MRSSSCARGLIVAPTDTARTPAASYSSSLFLAKCRVILIEKGTNLGEVSPALSIYDSVVADVGADVCAVVDQAVGTNPDTQQNRSPHAYDCHWPDAHPTGDDCAWCQMGVILNNAVMADYCPLIDDNVVPDRAARPDGRADENMASMPDHRRLGNDGGRVDDRWQDKAYGGGAFKLCPSLLVGLGAAYADEGVSRALAKQTLEAIFLSNHRNTAADVMADGQRLIGAADDFIPRAIESIYYAGGVAATTDDHSPAR